MGQNIKQAVFQMTACVGMFSFTQHLNSGYLLFTIYYVPCTTLNALTRIHLHILPSQSLCEVGTILVIHILETKKLADKEVKLLAQVSTDKASRQADSRVPALNPELRGCPRESFYNTVKLTVESVVS